MSGRLRVPPALAALLLLAAGAFTSVRALDPLHEGKRAMKVASTPLYFPAPRTVLLLSSGHRTTLADILYLWSIQRFSEPAPDPGERAEWLWRVYSTITDLDPHFRDAYWLAFVSLLVEGRSPDRAFALADKALVNEPDFTWMAIEAAMSARQYRRPELALHYLELGSKGAGGAEGRPLALRLYTLMAAEGMTVQQELGAYADLLDEDDELTRAMMERHVKDLRTMLDTTILGALVECHVRERGFAPGSLEQLVKAGYLDSVPLDPEGRPYEYDARSRTVRSSRAYFYRPPSRSKRGVDLSGLGRCAP